MTTIPIPEQRTPAEFLSDAIAALDTRRESKGFELYTEQFHLYDGVETTVHFETDPDLYLGCSRALGNKEGKPRANQAALVLIELGIDGNAAHLVRVDRTGNYPGPKDDPKLFEDAFNYPRGQSGNAFILRDAIAAAQAVLDQLLAMHSASEAREGTQA